MQLLSVFSYCVQVSNHPSKTTKSISIRMKNEDLDILDVMVEAGGFANRNDCLRAFIRPSFEMARAALETKSLTKCLSARISAEKALMDHINSMVKSSQVQEDLFGDLPEVVGVSPA